MNCFLQVNVKGKQQLPHLLALSLAVSLSGPAAQPFASSVYAVDVS